MRIAFVAAECNPLIKVGGLADVVGALPKALKDQGHDVRIFMPAYQAIDAKRFPSHASAWAANARFDGQDTIVHARETVLPQSSVPIYLIEWPEEFSGDVYPLGQDVATLRSVIRRFMRFSVAASALLTGGPWRPELVHCHDWHTALMPALLRSSGLPTVLTIHNIDIQGNWNAAEALGWLGVDQSVAPWDIRDSRGDLNMLQVGIRTARQVTTVSPTYASELVTSQYGEGLTADLRRQGVVGILNGIDTVSYDPSTDLALPEHFSVDTVKGIRTRNKAALQAELGLPSDPSAPLFVNIGRLVQQKGIDLLLPLIPKIVEAGGQVACLGSGFPDIEAALRAAEKYPGVRAHIGFDSSLGRRLYAGGDFFLMPSRFEPCGLGQMIAMRYGCLPIVRDTGGLHDTVVDLESEPSQGVGFRFSDPTSESAWSAIERAMALYHDSAALAAAIDRSMKIDHSWYTSAQLYGRLYEQLAAGPRDH